MSIKLISENSVGGYRVALLTEEDTCMINTQLPNGMKRIIVLFITGVFNLDTRINHPCLLGRAGIVIFKV